MTTSPSTLTDHLTLLPSFPLPSLLDPTSTLCLPHHTPDTKTPPFPSFRRYLIPTPRPHRYLLYPDIYRLTRDSLLDNATGLDLPWTRSRDVGAAPDGGRSRS